MHGPSQQDYDRGITIFSPDGRLYQVEYAREAVRRGAASMGITTTESVILLVNRGDVGRLAEGRSIEKLHKADDHIGIASAGHVADGRLLIDYAREQAKIEQLRYGEQIGIERLTKSITDHMQTYTQTGGVRPFGAALLVGGIESDAPQLYEIDPGGAPRGWRATAIGEGQDDLLGMLESDYKDDLTHRQGLEIGLNALATIKNGSIKPTEIGIATITTESQTCRELKEEDIRELIADLDLLGERENR